MYAPASPLACGAPLIYRVRGGADEKNERSKALIRTKIEEYLARAEMLKQHIQAAEGKTKRAVGANGTGSKKAYVPRAPAAPAASGHLTPTPPTARTGTRTSRIRR